MPSWYPSAEHPLNGVFFQDQARALRDAGHRVGVLFPHLRRLRSFGIRPLRENHGQITSEMEEGIPTVRWNGWNVPAARLRPRLFSDKAERLLITYRDEFGAPDLVHAHSCFWAGAAAERLRRRYGLPYVLTEHHSSFICGGISSWKRPIVETSFSSSSRLLSVSDELRRHMRPFAENRSIDVVPNMVDTSYFVPPKHPRSRSPFRFLTISFLNENKAVDVLIRAFQRAFSADDPVMLEIGGDGPSRSALERLTSRLGLNDHIHFLGMLSRSAVRSAMHRADAFVLSSRRETFGVVLIEAMATGLPIVATRAGGPQEIVSSRTGLLVEPGDVKDLAHALNEMHSRVSKYSADLIRRHAVERYGRSAVVERLSAYYRSVASEPTPCR